MIGSRRIGDSARWGGAALAVMTATGRPDRGSPKGARLTPCSTCRRSLAIEAARTRLRLFVDDNPEAVEGLPADAPECPLISVQAFNDVASVVGAERNADLRLQLDPWLGRTTSDPELRPDFASEGEVEGIPIVRCDSARPSDGSVDPAGCVRDQPHWRGDVRRLRPALLAGGDPRCPAGRNRWPPGRRLFRH